jgi:pSer/pThr/pTyr-binding forkhead associated (FHA) protein
VVSGPAKTWKYPGYGDAFTLGRSDENEVVLESPNVSRRHAQIIRHGSIFTLRDLGSANGIWVGDERVEQLNLYNGAQVRIGSFHLVFKSGFTSEALTIMDQGAPTRSPVVFVPGLWARNYIWAPAFGLTCHFIHQP